MKSLLLNRSEVASLIHLDSLVDAMKTAFIENSRQDVIEGQRFFSALPGPGDMMLLAPGLSPGIAAYSVKVHAKFPDQNPAIRGALLLNDLKTGALMAVMDSTYLTSLRTGLSAAIATHALARQNADSVAVIGAGVQGQSQLRYLCALRPIRHVTVFDTNETQLHNYIEQMSTELGIVIEPSSSLVQALTDADIVLCATWAKTPIIMQNMISPGTHLTTLGADQPGEAEIDGTLIKRSLFVCDKRELALSMGAIGGAQLGIGQIHAELGEVLSDHQLGRVSDEQITIYGGVGVPFQDLVVAWHVYSNVDGDKKEYRRFEFSA